MIRAFAADRARCFLVPVSADPGREMTNFPRLRFRANLVKLPNLPGLRRIIVTASAFALAFAGTRGRHTKQFRVLANAATKKSGYEIKQARDLDNREPGG